MSAQVWAHQSRVVDTRLRARAWRVNEKQDLGALLQHYGYQVYPDPHREQQFRCELHGSDRKPSARFYPSTNSTYCWVCQKSRRPVDYVMEHEGLVLKQAVDLLETRLGLPPLNWRDEEESESDPEEELEKLAHSTLSYAEERKRLRKFLQTLTTERELTPNVLLKFWETFDRVNYEVSKEGLEETTGANALQLLRQDVMMSLKETA
jgi:DNA primase